MKTHTFDTTTSDKVQIGDTSGTTSTTYWTNPSYQSEKGWECPRCKRINAPWVRQCDCNGNNWTITSDWTYKPDWWKEITCNPNTFKVHPDTTIWKTPSSICQSDSATVAKANPNTTTYVTGHNPIVGGSDYWDEVKKEWTNVPKAYSNSITSVDSPWNQFSTLTNSLNKLRYEIEELKETK